MKAGSSSHYLDPNHPNYKRWQRSREISYERGKFVKKVISQYKELSNLAILDIGSGFGGTIENFIGNGNEIYSIEIDSYKLQNQINHPSVKKFLVNAQSMPFNKKFDVIILQDFIEHIENTESFIKYILNFLKDDGIIYLSTPNKLSVINIISDPHWGFPLVSIMSRKLIQKFFIPIFRKSEKHRTDTAELKTLKSLSKIFNQCGAEFQLQTNLAVQTLFKNPEQIIWSNLHLKFLRFVRFLRFENLIKRLANDRIGFVNNFLTPTFYFIIRKQIQSKK